MWKIRWFCSMLRSLFLFVCVFVYRYTEQQQHWNPVSPFNTMHIMQNLNWSIYTVKKVIPPHNIYIVTFDWNRHQKHILHIRFLTWFQGNITLLSCWGKYWLARFNSKPVRQWVHSFTVSYSKPLSACFGSILIITVLSSSSLHLPAPLFSSSAFLSSSSLSSQTSLSSPWPYSSSSSSSSSSSPSSPFPSSHSSSSTYYY